MNYAVSCLRIPTLLFLLIFSNYGWAAQNFQSCGINTLSLIEIAQALRSGSTINELKGDDKVRNQNIDTVYQVLKQRGTTEGLLSIMAFYSKCALAVKERYQSPPAQGPELDFFKCAFQSAVEFKILHHLKMDESAEKISAALPKKLQPTVNMLHNLSQSGLIHAVQFSLDNDRQCLLDAVEKYR